MPKIYEFKALIQKVHDIDVTYIEFSYDVKLELGKGRVKVHAIFDGEPALKRDGSLAWLS